VEVVGWESVVLVDSEGSMEKTWSCAVSFIKPKVTDLRSLRSSTEYEDILAILGFLSWLIPTT
jgi:hypothetical protein